MNESILNWLRLIGQQKLDAGDVERSLRYAKDLEQGLAKIRTYSQGVTIFGSARLKPTSKWYRLAEQLGADLAPSSQEAAQALWKLPIRVVSKQAAAQLGSISNLPTNNILTPMSPTT